MNDPITDDEVDLTLHTAQRACEKIMEDESSEEYCAGFCEDAIPMLRQIRDRLHEAAERAEKAEAERDRYRDAVRAASQWMTVGEWEEFVAEYPVAATELDEP